MDDKKEEKQGRVLKKKQPYSSSYKAMALKQGNLLHSFPFPYQRLLQETFSNVTFGDTFGRHTGDEEGGRVPWHLVGRGQGCCQISCVEVSPHNKELSSLKCQYAKVEKNPDIEQGVPYTSQYI